MRRLRSGRWSLWIRLRYEGFVRDVGALVRLGGEDVRAVVYLIEE